MMSSLDDLRKEIKKRRSAVTNKAGRIRRQTGAEVSGSEFDPRRNVGVEKTYNKAQLGRYLAELNGFMQRNVQFNNGGDGVPITRGTWNTINRLNNEVREAQESHAGRMDNLPAPLMGVTNKREKGATLGQAKQMLHPKADAGVKGPYSPIDFNTTTIPSEKAAKSLVNNLRKQLTTAFLPKAINQGRENLKKALTIMGEEGLVERVDNLSTEDFDALWFGSAFAEIAFMKYDVEQARAAGTSKEKWQDKVVDNAFEDVESFLDWAEGISDK